MQPYSRRYANLLRDGIIGLICGFALAIIAIFPDTWLTTIDKLEITAIIMGILLVGITIKVFYEDLRTYSSAKKEVDKYYGSMPNIIHFSKFDRVMQLSENGDAEITWTMALQNLSSDDIPSFAIGYDADIYDHDPNISTVKMKKVRIGVYDVPCPELCYEKTGVITGDDLHEEKGHFCIPFNQVGGLKGTKKGNKPKEIEVQINFTTFGIFKNIYEMAGEYYSQKISHLTGLVNITIIPPAGSNILINSTAHHPNGIEVHDIVSNIVDFKEMTTVKPPTANHNQISWTIKKPKLTYAYRINFRCLKNIKKVEGSTDG